MYTKPTLDDLIEHCQDGMPPQSFLMEHNVTLKELREDARVAKAAKPSIPPLTDEEVAVYVREEGF